MFQFNADCLRKNDVASDARIVRLLSINFVLTIYTLDHPLYNMGGIECINSLRAARKFFLLHRLLLLSQFGVIV